MPKHMKATYYPPHARVVVLIPQDRYSGQRGVVISTRNDAGDMWHRVRFTDAATADYLPEELSAAEGTSTNHQTAQED